MLRILGYIYLGMVSVAVVLVNKRGEGDDGFKLQNNMTFMTAAGEY